MFDDIIISVKGESKAEVCKKNKIDLMIENNPFNYKKITGTGTECLLYDDQGRFQLKDHYMSTWNEIEEYIERVYENEKNH